MCKVRDTDLMQCDTVRPQCGNCIKRRQVCPGYANAFENVHRNQNHVVRARVEQQTHRRKNPASADVVHDSQSLGSPSTSSSPEDTTIALIIWPAMPKNLGTSALDFFFAHYTRERGNRTACGWLEYLPEMYLAVNHDSPLALATTALAVNLVMLWSHQGCDTNEARSFYVKAVSSTKQAIVDPRSNTTDELLMTVFVLQFFDVLCARYRNERPSRTHRQGVQALLKHRGLLNFRTTLAKRMVLALRSIIAHQALNMHNYVDINSEFWKDYKPMPTSPEIELVQIEVELANLRSMFTQLRYLLTGHAPNHKALVPLLEGALAIDARLKQWRASVPQSWHPVRVHRDNVAKSIVDAGFYGTTCVVYLDTSIAHIFDFYRRLHVNVLVLMYQFHQAFADSAVEVAISTGEEIQTAIQQLVDDICASVPFHLGDLTLPTNPVHCHEVQYPVAVIEKVYDNFANGVSSRATMPASPADHAREAVLSAGWFLICPLNTVRALIENAGSGLRLREGQLDWLDGQIKRLQTIYLFPAPVW